MSLGEIRDEPVNETKADFAGSLEKLYDFIQIIPPAIKSLEAGNNQLLLAVNLTLASLKVRCNSWWLHSTDFHVCHIIPGILRPPH